MKKIMIIAFTIFLIILSAVIFFDSSNTASTNNEGLKKPDIATSFKTK